VRYVSTRGTAPVLDFGDVLLAGLAADGGLYVPETWPPLTPADLARFADAPYAEVATEVMWPFVDDAGVAARGGGGGGGGGGVAPITRDRFAELVTESYATFDHPDVVPLRDLGGGLWLAELFHGPTLAFKDVALQLVGRLFADELARRGEQVTIVGATSGDTGSAAIEACRDRDAIEIFILHPAGRTSEVQRRQMTTVDAPNVHNIAIEGTFDDCQDLVKALFADEAFRARVHLSAVNSINWARVMAQIVYYVTSATRLGRGEVPISVSVPTGNFGNVFAGYGAQRMGTPLRQIVIGSNRNDILTRFLESGAMTVAQVHPTLSPSMDIQISSNFERLLFELYGRDGAAVTGLLAEFRETGTMVPAADHLALLRANWSGERVDDVATTEIIARTYETTGVLVDPHTAVGLGAAVACRRDADIPLVTMATAHPAKFPDAVEAATGVRPALPDRLADLFERPERYDTLPGDLGGLRDHIDGVLLARRGVT
jgi:threonine synthase